MTPGGEYSGGIGNDSMLTECDESDENSSSGDNATSGNHNNNMAGLVSSSYSALNNTFGSLAQPSQQQQQQQLSSQVNQYLGQPMHGQSSTTPQMVDHLFSSTSFANGQFISDQNTPGFLQQQPSHMLRRQLPGSNSVVVHHPAQHTMERHSPLYAR